MGAALSTKQKAYLAQLAAEAWRAGGRVGSAEEYRHEAVVAACRKNGLRCCGQEDYKAVEAVLLDRLGRHGAAFEAQLRQATHGLRTAQAVLIRECEKAEVRLSYAASICRNQFRCDLDDASERQVWSLVYTVRNRAAGRRKGKGNGTGGADVTNRTDEEVVGV